MNRVKVAIIGCGAIGGFCARKIEKELSHVATVGPIFDIDIEQARSLKESLRDAEVAFSLKDLFASADLVVEAATPDIVEEVLQQARGRHTPCVIMSVGGLLGQEVVLKDLKMKGVKIYIPSGAIGGMDVFKTLDPSQIDEISLTTFKPPAALAGAPFITEQNIDLYHLVDELVVFEGSVDEAIAAFPQNINVAATLAVTSRCRDKLEVKIVVSPSLERNIHHVMAHGTFGKIEITCQNRPSAENPKTSQLALLSCVQTVREAIENMGVFKEG